MFWHVETAQVGSRFIITVPIHWLPLLITFPGVLGLAAWGMQNPTRKRTLGIVLGVAIFYGFMIFRSTTTFDTATNTATVRQFWLLRFWTSTYPLDQVSNVNVRTGDVVSALRLQMTDGSMISLSINDSGGNKERAAYQANQFLAMRTAQPDSQ